MRKVTWKVGAKAIAGLKSGKEEAPKVVKEESSNGQITKEQFEKYVEVQMSGVTNMFDVRRVEQLSGLSRPVIMQIMKGYSKLNEQFGKK